jgi:hypothetical protein
LLSRSQVLLDGCLRAGLHLFLRRCRCSLCAVRPCRIIAGESPLEARRNALLLPSLESRCVCGD